MTGIGTGSGSDSDSDSDPDSGSTPLSVSVVVCTYAMERYDVFSECVDSVLDQTYDPLEIVLVVDGNEEVFERVQEDYGGHEDVVVHCNDENQGISYSRTRGAELATGDVVAFIDDDAVAETDWVAELARVYEETDALAVGGHVAPDWITEKPDFFPEEFYWLVGCDERGMGEHMEELRNTYGSNISYRRDVFLEVGGYDENTGRKGDRHIQAHEAPVCIRMANKYGKGVIYNTDAVVHHKLFDYRGDFRWLVGRSFWQGYSKRIMDLLLPEAKGDKNEYLGQLLLEFVPDRLRGLAQEPSSAKAKQLVAIFVFTAAVGFGYLYGLVQSNDSLVSDPAKA
ncbi:glycosyl transferase family A [Halobiforma lacisalsi AJ5]|uniref:Family 2 glycosyl transferase n=1 Tax=Natronobacterium lacisalsi AJ5 TaxID=358396 RepID=M0L6L8_NATLA|nr:glucosyl-dolichyl phosphate glucuronosyltransferase [Halobiforma lacisalsi]APW97917.1 glycosyl transferase family A [Halobiforma lacisalsi AJ5]EMA29186.1 family 2 glycosyl transferase [Halobiforma lacisalsi AJ5]